MLGSRFPQFSRTKQKYTYISLSIKEILIYPYIAHVSGMGRKVKGEDLKRIVSTKLSSDDYLFLENYAKWLYNTGRIKLPSVSHALRKMVKLRKEAALKKGQSQSSSDLEKAKLEKGLREKINRVGQLPRSP